MVKPRLPTALGLPPNSRVNAGKSWFAPTDAQRVKEFHFYRYDPDRAARPQWLRFVGDVPFAIAALTMAFDFIVKLGPLFPAWTEYLTSRYRATSAE